MPCPAAPAWLPAEVAEEEALPPGGKHEQFDEVAATVALVQISLLDMDAHIPEDDESVIAIGEDGAAVVICCCCCCTCLPAETVGDRPTDDEVDVLRRGSMLVGYCRQQPLMGRREWYVCLKR